MLKKIFESTLIMGTSSVMVMGLDVIRVKVTAVLLGPIGIGTLSILNQFHTVAITIISLGLGTGIVKYVSTLNRVGEVTAVKKILSSAFQSVFLFALVAASISILFRSKLSNWMLGDSGSSYFILLYAVSLPLAVYPMTTGSFLQGLKRVNSLAKINVLRSCISLVCIVPLIYFFKLEGAVFSVLLATSIHLALNKYYIRSEKKNYRVIYHRAFDHDILKKLLPYGMATLLTGATYSLSHLLLKIIIVHELGMEMNGLYQPVWALTMTYLTIVLSSMSTYSYPKLCELRSNREIVEEVNGIIRVAVLMIMPVMLILFIARQPVIQLLYSSGFLGVTEYMAVQILGDFFKVLTWSAGAFLLPTNRLAAFIWLGVFTDAMLVVLAAALVKHYQLHGATFAFAFSYLFSFVAHYRYGKKQIGLYLWNKNRKLLAFSFSALLAIVISDACLTNILKLAAGFMIIVAWSLLSIEKEEVLQLKSYVSGKFRKPLTASNN